MNNEQNYLTGQLCKETFNKDVDEYSAERVEALIKLMVLNEPVNSDEIEEAQKRFEANFLKMTSKPKIKFKKFGRMAAIICLLVLGINFTAEAVMDESIIHMMQRWGNIYSIFPSKTESDYQEAQKIVYKNTDEFADSFEYEFLRCTWLPEGYELEKIEQYKRDDIVNYYWIFSNKSDQKITIQMYNKKSNNIAASVGSDYELSEQITASNGIFVLVGRNNDEYIGCFEYGNYWYLAQVEDKNMLYSLIGGMIEYEQN